MTQPRKDAPVSPSSSREVEGMFCISNITYSDGRWERPYYTLDPEKARSYLEFLVTGGWRGMWIERFEGKEWIDWHERVITEGHGRSAHVSFAEVAR